MILPLECDAIIFKSKKKLSIWKSALRTNESILMLIFWTNLNLILTRETIHEQKYFILGAIINNMAKEWVRIIILEKALLRS